VELLAEVGDPLAAQIGRGDSVDAEAQRASALSSQATTVSG